jgi:hypothetical protein
MNLQLTVMDVSARRAWSSPPHRYELVGRGFAVQPVDYEDSEDVPVVLASHLGGVYRIGPSTIQVTMVNRLAQANKTIIKAAVHEVWDQQAFLECQQLILFSKDQLERTNAPRALRKVLN